MRPDRACFLAKLRRPGIVPRTPTALRGSVAGVLRVTGLGAILLISAPLSGLALFTAYEPLPGDLAPKSVRIPNRDLVMDVGQQMPLFQVTKDHFIGLHATFGGDYELCAFPKQDRRGMGTAWVSEDHHLFFAARTKSCKGKLKLSSRQDLPVIGESGPQLTVRIDRYGRAVRIDVPRPKGFVLVRQSTTGQGVAAGGARGTIISNRTLSRGAADPRQSQPRILTDAKIQSVMRDSSVPANLSPIGEQSTASARLLAASAMHVEVANTAEPADVPSDTVSAIVGIVTGRIGVAALGTLLVSAFVVVVVRALRRKRATRRQRIPEQGIAHIPTQATVAPVPTNTSPPAPEPASVSEPPPLPLPRPEDCDTVLRDHEKPTAQPSQQPEPQPADDLQGFAVEDVLSPSATSPNNVNTETDGKDSDAPVFGGRGGIFSLTGSANP